MAKSRPNPTRKNSKRKRSDSGRIEYLPFRGDHHQLQLMSVELHGEPIRRSAPEVEPLLQRALVLMRERKAVKAEAVLKQALEIDPDDPALLNNLGQAYNLQGQMQKAEELAYELHERFPDYLFGRTNLAILLIEKGEIERAKKLIDPLRSRKRLHFSEFAAICVAKIQLSLAEGNKEVAESWLDMMKEIIPDDPNIPAMELRVRPSIKALLRSILRR